MKKRLEKLFLGQKVITSDDVNIIFIVFLFFIFQLVCAYFLRHAPLDF
jgi:hypothetical protein